MANRAPGGRAGKAGKIEVDACWFAGWGLLLTRSHRLLPQIWLPMLALFWIDTAIVPGAAQAALRLSKPAPMGLIGATLMEAMAYALIASSAYAVAFNRFDRWTLARLEIGAPELRYFAANILQMLVFYGLLIGAAVTAVRVMGFLAIRDVIATANPALSTAEWIKSLGPGGWAAIFSPLVVAALVFVWFATRYALVFPSVVAENRFPLFEAMALTKRNSWRLFALFILLGISFGLAAWVVTSFLHVPLDQYWKDAQSAEVSSRASSFMITPEKKAPLVSMGALVTVALGAAWQILVAGALARAYRSVKREAAE